MTIRQRPEALHGASVKIPTGVGTAYITINDIEKEELGGPFEVFVNVRKGGSDTQATAEAIGRLCSLVLRMNDGLTQEQRAREIIDQLHGIGGSRPIEEVRSLPDGVAKALRLHLERNDD